MFTFRQAYSLLVATLTAVLLPATLSAAPITFNFNDVPNNGGNSTVQTSMQNVLNTVMPGATVKVSGALGLTDYTGDDHVVGPVSNGAVTPLTLGSTDGGAFHSGLDAFIANDPSGDRITMTFSFPVYSVSFDYEIFPDGTGVLPDFTFAADGVTYFHMDGVLPANGPYPYSPVSGTRTPETVPQFLGSFSINFFDQGQTTLEFIDWPARIGIDNLVVDSVDPPPPSTAVPEPSGVVVWSGCLAGLALAGMAWGRRTRPLASVRQAFAGS